MRWEQADELRADPGRAPGERELGAPKRRSVLPAIAVVAAAAGFGGIIWFAYQQGRNAASDGPPPLVKADESPVKVKPDQPGGMEVPFQNSTVYDRLNPNAPKPQAEKLLPPPEAPAQRAQPQPQAQAQPASAAPTTLGTLPQVAQVTPDISSPTVLAPKPGQPLVSPTAPKAAPPTIASLAAAAVGETAPKPVAGGHYRIQVGAVKTEAAVESEWTRLKSRYASVLGGLKVTSAKTEVAGKGTFYRIQAGPLDEARAKSACTQLKSQGLGCIVVKS